MTDNTMPPDASNQPISTKSEQTLLPAERNQEDTLESDEERTLMDFMGPRIAPHRMPLFRR